MAIDGHCHCRTHFQCSTAPIAGTLDFTPSHCGIALALDAKLGTRPELCRWQKSE